MPYEIVARQYHRGARVWHLRLEQDFRPILPQVGAVLRDGLGRIFRVQKPVGVDPGWTVVRPVDNKYDVGPSKDYLTVEV